MAMTGSGLFLLCERSDGDDQELSPALPLDDFVRFVNAQGPQQVPRITRNDAAFARQLLRASTNAPLNPPQEEK
jgi:hypothetical protein